MAEQLSEQGRIKQLENQNLNLKLTLVLAGLVALGLLVFPVCRKR